VDTPERYSGSDETARKRRQSDTLTLTCLAATLIHVPQGWSPVVLPLVTSRALEDDAQGTAGREQGQSEPGPTGEVSGQGEARGSEDGSQE
jgi:hypothetical protein